MPKKETIKSLLELPLLGRNKMYSLFFLFSKYDILEFYLFKSIFNYHTFFIFYLDV